MEPCGLQNILSTQPSSIQRYFPTFISTINVMDQQTYGITVYGTLLKRVKQLSADSYILASSIQK